MTPIQEKVVAAKVGVVRHMVQRMATLPLANVESCTRDPRLVAAGKSFLRRALEALRDLGRYILAKGFGEPVAEYGAGGPALYRVGVPPPRLAQLVAKMGGYRNRLIYGYQEVRAEELFTPLTRRGGDLLEVL